MTVSRVCVISGTIDAEVALTVYSGCERRSTTHYISDAVNTGCGTARQIPDSNDVLTQSSNDL